MFPLFFDLRDKLCLVVGGGKVAVRKARVLLEHCSRVRVVAEQVSAEMRSLGVEFEERRFMPSDLQDVFFVAAATDDGVLNSTIGDLCSQRHILVNVATPYDGESVMFPAVIARGETVVGINSGGDPALSKQIRMMLERALPLDLEKISKEGLAYRTEQKSNLSGKALKCAMDAYFQRRLGE